MRGGTNDEDGVAPDRDPRAARGIERLRQVYGIGATKVVDASPDDACVVTALKATPGVGNVVSQTKTNDDWVLLGPGPRHGTPIRYFAYDIGNGPYPPGLVIGDHGPGKYRVSNAMFSLNARIPKADRDKALPVMVDAERHISKACGVPVEMQHQCDGEACGPTPS